MCPPMGLPPGDVGIPIGSPVGIPGTAACSRVHGLQCRSSLEGHVDRQTVNQSLVEPPPVCVCTITQCAWLKQPGVVVGGGPGLCEVFVTGVRRERKMLNSHPAPMPFLSKACTVSQSKPLHAQEGFMQTVFRSWMLKRMLSGRPVRSHTHLLLSGPLGTPGAVACLLI